MRTGPSICVLVLAALAATAVAALQISGAERLGSGTSYAGYQPHHGYAASAIDGSIVCTVTDCQMGNLVCDALLEYTGYSQDAQVCITNADSINGTLAAGPITAQEISNALPYPDFAIVLKVPGSTIKAVLEKMLSVFGNPGKGGHFPQIGGMYLKVNSSAPAGSRVSSLTIRGVPVVASKKYNVVTNNFLADGGYNITWSRSKNVTGHARLVNEIVKEFLKKHSPNTPAPVGRISGTVIGKTTKDIDGSRSSCRSGECQLGDLLCDALLQYGDTELAPDACLVNGGSINGSISMGDIMTDDVYTALPYPDLVEVVKINGSTLVAALEHGLTNASAPSGAFPQVAGMVVVYKVSAPAGSRVQSVTIGGKKLVSSKKYTLITIDFVAKGGDGYTWPGATILAANGRDMRIVVEEYLVRKSPYTPVSIPASGGRIVKA